MFGSLNVLKFVKFTDTPPMILWALQDFLFLQERMLWDFCGELPCPSSLLSLWYIDEQNFN